VTKPATRSRCASLISGPHLGLLVGRLGDHEARYRCLEQLHERVVRAPLHKDARTGAAVLAGIVECGIRRGGGCRRQVRVGEHDVGALAAELERHRLDLPGAASHDLAADLGRAGEDDLRDARVVDQPLPDDAALAGQHL